MITTNNINGRSDWFHASGQFRGVIYTSFMSTRHAAFMDVLRQVAVKASLSAKIHI